MNLQALSGAVSGAVADAVVAALNSCKVLGKPSISYHSQEAECLVTDCEATSKHINFMGPYCLYPNTLTTCALQVLSANSDAELREQLQSLDYSFRYDCGYYKPVSAITFETRTEFVRCILLHFLYSVYAEISQLRKGLLETLSFKKLADEHPMELWSLLAASKAEMFTAVEMQDLFQVHYSPRGSNHRVREESIIMHLYNFLQECEDSSEVSLGDFLAFVSGTNRPPAIGFVNTPSIHFTDDNRLPYVSTCAITLTLPRNIPTYQAFKETMQLAVLGSHGFGNV